MKIPQAIGPAEDGARELPLSAVYSPVVQLHYTTNQHLRGSRLLTTPGDGQRRCSQGCFGQRSALLSGSGLSLAAGQASSETIRAVSSLSQQRTMRRHRGGGQHLTAGKTARTRRSASCEVVPSFLRRCVMSWSMLGKARTPVPAGALRARVPDSRPTHNQNGIYIIRRSWEMSSFSSISQIRLGLAVFSVFSAFCHLSASQ